jgi:hypothetical protein
VTTSRASETPLFPRHYRAPFGSPAALENVGTSAAPLLAGFAFALVGLILDKGHLVWQPDLVLLLLVSAGILLVYSVQFAFNARRYHVPPGDYLAFLEIAAKEPFPQPCVRRWQGQMLEEHERWAARARGTYNIGILLLLSGVTLLLVPHAGPCNMPAGRVFAVVVALIGTTLEAGWQLGIPSRVWGRPPENMECPEAAANSEEGQA